RTRTRTRTRTRLPPVDSPPKRDRDDVRVRVRVRVRRKGAPELRVLKPYVAPDRRLPEFTVRAVVLGTLLSVAFGMVNAYLGLKVGLTTSASIPAAVLSMAVLRGVLRSGTILENNVVQTIASSGDSLAAGVVFTIPALIFLDLDARGFRIFLIAASAR